MKLERSYYEHLDYLGTYTGDYSMTPNEKERDEICMAVDVLKKLVQASHMPENPADITLTLIKAIDDLVWTTYQELG